MALSDERLGELAARLAAVPGVAAVLLGGSRARGTHRPDSDTDLGIYYHRPLDVAALGVLARAFGGPAAQVTPVGEWGPWVDGGGWLSVDGAAVDWIYRDVDRVARAWADAEQGRYAFHAQAGHPLGVPDFAYAGEVALGVVLADPTGELGRIKERLRDYPAALGAAVVRRLDEARFLLGIVTKPAHREDTTFVAGCLFRVVTLCAHALHARAGRWVVNEKGLVDAAGRLDPAPDDFAERAHDVLARLGTDATSLRAAVGRAERLVDEVSRACGTDAAR